MRSGRSVDFELSLAADLIHGGLVGQLAHKLVRLNVDILFAWRRLGRLHISREEFFRGLGSLLLESFGVVLALVGLEKLVGVGSCGNDHGGIGAPAEHPLIKCDVLRHVLLWGRLTVRVLVLGFGWHHAGMGSEAGRRTCRLAVLLLLLLMGRKHI